MAWFTQGYITDPVNAEILADTGALSAGTANITLMVWADAGCLVDLVQRNALNTADVNVQQFSPGGNMIVSGIPITFLINQRLQLRLQTGFTGHIQASIITG